MPFNKKIVFAVITLWWNFCEGFHIKATSKVTSPSSFLWMKWVFPKGNGRMSDIGGVGSQGELYYIQNKVPKLKVPENCEKSALGKEVVIPILPRNIVPSPLGTEVLGVYEMRYRQIINDVGEGGLFGCVYFSQDNGKLGLVGTLTKVKKIDRLEDGGLYALLEGKGRFYLKGFKTEKPYLKAQVQLFNDYSNAEDNVLDSWEATLLSEIRYSVKLMGMLYPQNNYTLNSAVLKYRPLIYSETPRAVKLPREEPEMIRRSKFSFGVTDQLKTESITKLALLQEPSLDKRLVDIIKILRESSSFLEGELKRRNVVASEDLPKLRERLLSDMSDMDQVSMESWQPQTYVNGEWAMRPVLMD